MAYLVVVGVALIVVGWTLGVAAYQLATVGAISDPVLGMMGAAGGVLAWYAYRKTRRG